METEDGDEYFVAFDYVVDNQDMLSNVKWGKYIMERLGIAAKRKPAKVIDFTKYIDTNRSNNH